MNQQSRLQDIAQIHPLAHVQAGTEIGARTKVWQFASVIRGTVIGEDCNIASCVIVDSCRLGNRVIVSHGAFLDPGMLIEDDVFIGPHVIFCNDRWPKFSKEGWFTQDDLFGPDKVTVSCIRRHASVGAGAILMPGVEIGENSMVSAGAVVTRSIGKDMLWKRDGTVVDANMTDRKRFLWRGPEPEA